MDERFDKLEIRSVDEREADLFERLPAHLDAAVHNCPGLAVHLEGCNPKDVVSRTALAQLPVLRKAELMDAQADQPPFGGFANPNELDGLRVFQSPGPIWEPQGFDPRHCARALFAAGFRRGHVVHNALSYHMTPGAFLLEQGALELGCSVFPAGVGNTQMQVAAAASLKPHAYTGTPDYLKVMLDMAGETGADLSSIKRALVSGGALFPSLRAEYGARGVLVMQAYATADLGIIAYESLYDGVPVDTMVVNEDLIVEIVRPGTNDPVNAGDVGEVVVTNFSTAYPLVRFGTGDLSKVVSGPSPCGRTNMRLAGWMGRADQRTKVKGMFVDPRQVAEVMKRHPNLTGARLVVARDGSQDTMLLRVTGADVDTDAVASTLRDITKLGGLVEQADELPNDGKVIADERDYDA